ncbi:hypothetical protein [Phytohabitans houttuyneae]|uniref:Uncharacterized protein n=1 Tax=Phytohabitans houttuyneae TaxID=1076126 RepID=A0A6V8KAC2_9ACTN|nr:hypothetical protein [Phytohabitans houttuyneae]GFJ79401.1 hypothetical protein Phou_035810 [Phytohabitans houttuyneae]
MNVGDGGGLAGTSVGVGSGDGVGDCGGAAGLPVGAGRVRVVWRGFGRSAGGGVHLDRSGVGDTVTAGARPSCPVPEGAGVTADAGGTGSACARA